jgi:hypothetical protein
MGTRDTELTVVHAALVHDADDVAALGAVGEIKRGDPTETTSWRQTPVSIHATERINTVQACHHTVLFINVNVNFVYLRGAGHFDAATPGAAAHATRVARTVRTAVPFHPIPQGRLTYLHKVHNTTDVNELCAIILQFQQCNTYSEVRIVLDERANLFSDHPCVVATAQTIANRVKHAASIA